MPGIQLLNNPQFLTGVPGWTLSPGAGQVVELVNGQLHIVSTGGTANHAMQSVFVPGVWQLQVFVNQITGLMQFGVASTGPFQTISTPGLKTINVTNPGNATFLIGRIAAQASEVYIEWATARRMDISMSKLILTMRDFDGHRKDTSAMLGPITDGASYVARKGEADALEDAINAVAGNVAHSSFLANDSAPNDANAVDVSYQTHYRWIVWFVDSVTGDGPYQFDIPTPKLSDNTLVLASSIEHNPAHADWIAFKAAFNGKVLNPKTASTVNITRIFLEQ